MTDQLEMAVPLWAIAFWNSPGGTRKLQGGLCYSAPRIRRGRVRDVGKGGRLVEKAGNTFRVVRQDQKVDTGGPCPGPEDGDALWVTPKVSDVFTEPSQGLNLIQEPVVAFRGLVTGAEET